MKTIAALLFCCFIVLGFFANLVWHLSILGFWGSLALVAALIGIVVLCRKKATTSPK